MVKKSIYPAIVIEMAKREERIADVGRIADLTEQSMSSRLQGRSQFRINEIERLCKHYKMNFEELFKKEEKTNDSN